jgi:hypothetical protein
MDCKVQNIGLMILNLKKVKAPVCLTAANIACLQIVLNLIMGSFKLHGGVVMALVHILVNVLDSFDRGNGLHINMTPVLPDEILAMTNDPSVVDLIYVLWACTNDLASVKMPCPCIRVFYDSGALIKGLRKPFGAFAILNARGLPVLFITGTMDHELFDQLKQLRIVHRKLRGHEAVNLLWGMQLGMGLRKTMICAWERPLF